MVENTILGIVLTVALAAVVIFFALKLGKKLILLVINGFLGLVALVIINFTGFVNIDINIISVLIAALGGLLGIVLLILLSTLGIAF